MGEFWKDNDMACALAVIPVSFVDVVRDFVEPMWLQTLLLIALVLCGVAAIVIWVRYFMAMLQGGIKLVWRYILDAICLSAGLYGLYDIATAIF